jgi:hypothetical protein
MNGYDCEGTRQLTETIKEKTTATQYLQKHNVREIRTRYAEWRYITTAISIRIWSIEPINQRNNQPKKMEAHIKKRDTIVP